MAYFRCIGGNDKYVNFKQGTFISANTQYGIVNVNVGFKPDLLIVKLPFTNGDTVSYWEKGLNYAETHSVWCLQPAEGASNYLLLGRTSGETGIQQINNNGFSFMSNAANTRNVECSYTAVKYESGGSAADVTFSKRIIEQGWDGTGSSTYTFDEDINDCILILTYTRETTLSDTRYTLTLASGSYSVMQDSGVVVGSTTQERIVYIKAHNIKIGDSLYMYNYGDLKTADIITIA